MSFPYLGHDLFPFSVGPSLLLGLENPPVVCLTSGPCIVVLIFKYINPVATTGPSQCSWYSHRRIIKETGGRGNKRMSGNHPNYYIIEIHQNTEKNPGDLRRFTVTPYKQMVYEQPRNCPGKSDAQLLVFWNTNGSPNLG